MLYCLSRYGHSRLLMVMFCLLFLFSSAYAEEADIQEEQPALSLESDILFLDTLSPPTDSEVVNEVPAAALSLPP